MKPIKYHVAHCENWNPNTITEFINNQLARLNEEDAPVHNDMETHWELDSQFADRDGIFFVFAQWTERY